MIFVGRHIAVQHVETLCLLTSESFQIEATFSAVMSDVRRTS